MFAPWCPTCSSRMLLGARRIVAIEARPAGMRVTLRCFCQSVLVWSASGDREAPWAVPVDGHGPDLHRESA